MRALACLCMALGLLGAAVFVSGGRVSAMGPPSDPYWVMGALRMELGCIPPPSWSPDGRRLAFIVESSEDYKMHVATVDVATRTLRVFCRGWVPNWSPGGDLIAFLDHEPGKGDGLYVIPAQGGAARRLSEAPVGLHTAWSPDGRYLAFEHIREWDSPPRFTDAWRITCGEVCIADAASATVRQMTDFAGAFPPGAHYLSASPRGWTGQGGLLVVDAATEDGAAIEGIPGVYLLDLSTRHLRKLFDGEFATAAVSPDGLEALLTREHSREGEFGFRDLQTEVLLGRPKDLGSRRVALSRHEEEFSGVTVSWSRRQLLAAGRELGREAPDGVPSHVLTSINLDSGAMRVLTPQGVRDGAPAVSPDGSQVAFYRRGESGPDSWGLCVMGMDGRRARLVGPHQTAAMGVSHP